MKVMVRSLGISLATTLILSLAGSVYAQKVWSLGECINYAIDNNIQVKQYELNVKLQETNYLGSKLDMLPNVNGYVSHGYNWGQTIDRFTNQFATSRVRSNNFYAQSSMTVFNGFQKLNTLKRNKLNLEAAQFDSDKFLDDISVSIATYYLQVLYNTEALKVAQSQYEITLQQVERTRKLVEAGTLAQGDLLTVEAQAASEESGVVNARNNLDLSYLDLVQALDLPSTDDFEVEKPQITISKELDILPGPEAVYNYALINRPEIKGAEVRLDAAEKGISIARGTLSPNLSISGTWGTGYSGANTIGENPTTIIPQIGITENGIPVYSIYETTLYADYKAKAFGDQMKDNKNYSFMVNLSIPIFNGWQSHTAIQQARINRENAVYELELEKLNLNKNINQAYSDAVAAYKKFNAARKQVNATNEAFKYAEQKFNVGLINSLEYNEAKKNLTLAQSNLLTAKYDYLFTVTILDFYMGKPLSIEQYTR